MCRHVTLILIVVFCLSGCEQGRNPSLPQDQGDKNTVKVRAPGVSVDVEGKKAPGEHKAKVEVKVPPKN